MQITPSVFIHRLFWTWKTCSELTFSGDTEKEGIETEVSHSPSCAQESSLWAWELLVSPADPLQQVGRVAAVPCLRTEGKNTFT